MTVPVEPALTGGRDAAGPRTGRAGAVRGAPWFAAIPVVVTFGVMLYQLGRPSLWQDEVSTLSDISRPIPAMFRLLGHIDAVHGAYYLFMWFWIRVAGTSDFALRFPSAVAMAVAAGFLALIGQRLVSARAGLAAGLVFAAMPYVSWYGQDAREVALVTAGATIASYEFVRLLQAPAGRRRRWLIAYGVTVALMGLGNLFTLLLVPAHALTLAWWLWRSGGARDRRRLVRGWLAATVAAGVVVSPVAVMGYRERGQISWLRRPTLRIIIGAERVIGDAGLFTAVVVIVAAAVVVSALRGRARLRTDWPGQLAALSLPWLVLPPVVLLGVSQLHPVYTLRYIIFCSPAAALLAGTALAALGRVAGAVTLAVIVLLGLPAQVSARAPAGHGQNLREVSSIIGANSRPGDALVFGNSYARKIEIGYPAGFRRLRDVSLGEGAVAAAQVAGLNAPEKVIAARLATAQRVWLVEVAGQPKQFPPLGPLGFTPVRQWLVTGTRIVLLARGPASS